MKKFTFADGLSVTADDELDAVATYRTTYHREPPKGKPQGVELKKCPDFGYPKDDRHAIPEKNALTRAELRQILILAIVLGDKRAMEVIDRVEKLLGCRKVNGALDPATSRFAQVEARLGELGYLDYVRPPAAKAK